MPDFKKMTLQSLRELARKKLGPRHSRLKTKVEIIEALEAEGAAEADEPSDSTARGAGARARSPGTRAGGAPVPSRARSARSSAR